MVLIYNNNTNSNNMFHSFFRNLFGAEKHIETCLKRNLGGKLLQSQGYAGLELKLEAPVSNGTFQQREKYPFPCDSVTGMVHPAKYPYPSCTLFEWTWEKQALLFTTYLNREYKRTRKANFNPSLGM